MKFRMFVDKKYYIYRNYYFTFDNFIENIMENNDNQGKKELSLELSKEVAPGNYSNLALITHSTSEFIIDFARLLPGVPKATICTRVIMTPEHAKRLMLALKENIAKFENQYGDIKLHNPGVPPGAIPIPFGPNANA